MYYEKNGSGDSPKPLMISLLGKYVVVSVVAWRDYSRMAAMPGSSLPSRYSSMAPPPVDT